MAHWLINLCGVGDPERAIIFFSNQQMKLLVHSNYFQAVFRDHFSNLHNSCRTRWSAIAPCICTPAKQKSSHIRKIFPRIAIGVNWPADILLNFERSALNAISNIRPNIEKNGCFYHLCTNVWKHIQQYGLHSQYNVNDENALHLQMVCTLALLPPEEVIREENVSELLDYF